MHKAKLNGVPGRGVLASNDEGEAGISGDCFHPDSAEDPRYIEPGKNAVFEQWSAHHQENVQTDVHIMYVDKDTRTVRLTVSSTRD